jgi:murein DD-endopeptidase MepM/ murein hydrolase activator NlpD
MWLLARAAVCAAVVGIVQTGPAHAAAGTSGVAALQVALRAQHLYTGPIDGRNGPATTEALRALQRRAGIPADGVVRPATRVALGRYGAPRLGRRVVVRDMVGWDVAELQFLLARHGFPSGPFDGHLSLRTETALRRFQAWTGIAADGRAGPGTIAALRRPAPTSPIPLAHPVPFAPTDLFGPRGDRFHAGIDYPAPRGTPVTAAAGGRVTSAGWSAGGWGRLVTITHGSGIRTLYAHLSRVDVRVGERVQRGAPLGLVGASGAATGPHLHFEVHLRGAAVDPLPALTLGWSARRR